MDLRNASRVLRSIASEHPNEVSEMLNAVAFMLEPLADLPEPGNAIEARHIVELGIKCGYS